MTKSPVVDRKEASSDQYTVSPSASSEDGSRPTSPIHDGPGPGGGPDTFCWPTQSNYEENRQLLGTEEESSDRQSSEDEVDVWRLTSVHLIGFNFRMMNLRTSGSSPRSS